MPRQKIHDTLNALHEQLADASTFDEADRSHLREILQEIEQALSGKEAHETVGDRVKQAVVAFEATHPTVATALRGIVNSLKKL